MWSWRPEMLFQEIFSLWWYQLQNASCLLLTSEVQIGIIHESPPNRHDRPTLRTMEFSFRVNQGHLDCRQGISQVPLKQLLLINSETKLETWRIGKMPRKMALYSDTVATSKKTPWSWKCSVLATSKAYSAPKSQGILIHAGMLCRQALIEWLHDWCYIITLQSFHSPNSWVHFDTALAIA